jgi:hypothetical protein
MNKNTFMWILECALLRWDGVEKEGMIELGASEKEATAGIQLYNYLKPIEVKQ